MMRAISNVCMNLMHSPTHLVDCTPLLCTIACENTVACHSCCGILVNGAPGPGRVGVEHTGRHIAPECVLKQPPTACPHPVVGESAVLHRACNQLAPRHVLQGQYRVF